MPGRCAWRASSQSPVNPLGPADDPAAYRKQQRHPGDYQRGRLMVCRLLMNGSPKTRPILRMFRRQRLSCLAHACLARTVLRIHGSGSECQPSLIKPNGSILRRLIRLACWLWRSIPWFKARDCRGCADGWAAAIRIDKPNFGFVSFASF